MSNNNQAQDDNTLSSTMTSMRTTTASSMFGGADPSTLEARDKPHSAKDAINTATAPQYGKQTATPGSRNQNLGPSGGANHEEGDSDSGAEDSGHQQDKKKKKKNKKKNKKKPSAGEGNNERQSRPAEQQRQHDHQVEEEEDEELPNKDFTPLKDKIGQSFFEDQDSSEDEGMPDYKIGGYHPVHVGEILLDRYVIIQKLGWGHFSTVWLTKDLKYNSYVAMKVQKSAQHYLEAAYDEVEILDQVATNWKSEDWERSVEQFYKDDPHLKACLEKYGMSGDTSHCVQLLNSFIHHGPNGKHFVMVFEILGVNFLEIIKRYDYKGVPIPLVRKLTRQCLIGLDYMHRMCKIIHTDFKPENVVICLREDEVIEIAKTGQLTTTKMYEHQDIIRKLNMKIAGTLPKTKTSPAPAAPTEPEPVPEVKTEKKETAAANVADGLTAKQRKNQKKKQQRKKKKAQVNQDGGSDEDESGAEEAKKEEEVPAKQVADEDPTKKKKQTKKASVDARGGEKQIGNLLNDEEELNGAAAQQTTVGKSKRGPKIDENVMVKICDMGNGCWTYHHFTPEIQTRQYRSPEVIIGADYDTSADIWSLACTVFEMVTGDFLFEPRKGNNYDKDDDHLAQMMELLGRMPKNMALSGKHSKKYFNSQGHLRRISGLNYWPLKKVLMEKYRIKEEEAQCLSDFLVPMLTWYPHKRATAQQMLSHPWLNKSANYDYKYTDKEYEIMMLKKEMKMTGSKGGKGASNAGLDDSQQEMNELIESDEEVNAADVDEDRFGAAHPHHLSSDEEGIDGDDEDYEYDGDELSLVDSDEERAQFRRAKGKQGKINNSFTGPYPLDPTDFNHTDKGPNYQFETLVHPKPPQHNYNHDAPKSSVQQSNAAKVH